MEFPKKGDIIIADARPHAGHEMGRHNPEKEISADIMLSWVHPPIMKQPIFLLGC